MKKLVLTVDDSKTMREMLSFTLKNANFDVLEACDGEEGLRLLDYTRPDLVISDVNMPKLDGFSFVKALRRVPEFQHVPVLMLTTEQTDEKKSQGRAAGATGWIVKPFDPEKLIQVINKVCG
jgi:two-component system chemotaxis response regulator CheY